MDSNGKMDERSIYLRKMIIDSFKDAGKGHVGGSMSAIDIIRVLYDDIMRYRPKEPMWEGRDRFILSKGHSCFALYAILADKGFFPKEVLSTFSRQGSILGGHPERGKVPGIEASTGALGHGCSIGIGMALAAKMKKRDTKIFVMVGDGECNEGSVWEAALCASKHKLSNLKIIVDYNKVQSSGPTYDVLDLEPIADKWKSFGFNTLEINGHNLSEIRQSFQNHTESANQPTAVICHTIKGKGISFAENTAKWHYKRIKPGEIDKINAALEENR
jgi:transketolase